MVDVNRVIQSIVKSGRAFYGAHETTKTVKAGRAVAIIVSGNCPKELLQTLDRYAASSRTPVIGYPGSSRDLGLACQKPFAVSTLAVREIPEQDLAQEVKESVDEEKVQNQI